MKFSGYRGYMLNVLLVIQAFNFADRGALGIVMQDIKAALSLTDTQLGLLAGMAFAFFYSIMGIPIARWADRGNRVTIISLTCALWSLMVALCGAAGGFLQLLLIRVGVAVGEAGCVPAANSLISDTFDRSERPRAFARYMLGGPLSVILGYFVAGWLNEFYGWRITFALVGLPGLVLAAVAAFTLREPRREKEAKVEVSEQPGVWEVLRTLWGNRTFVHLLISFAVMYFFSFGVWQWVPAFFVRAHGLQTGVIGTCFALIWGVGGMLGTFFGGELASRYANNNERLQLTAMAIIVATFGLVVPVIFITDNYVIAFAVMTLAAIAWSSTYGPWFATIQTLVPERMRAMAIAIVFLFANLIGMGIGPLMTGVLSDAFRPWAGDDSLRYALLALCPGYVWAGWHLWRASRLLPNDLPGEADQGRHPASDASLQSRSPPKILPAGR